MSSAPSSAASDPALWLAHAQLITLVPTGGPPSVVGSVAGGPVAGSWWAHPRGGEMYRLASALGELPDAWVLRLVDGKVTYVHRALWPALLRVVTDLRWRAPRLAKLPEPARALAERVAADGEVPVSGADRRLREQVEARLLAVGQSDHGADGAHHATLRSWRIQGASVEPTDSPYDEALAALTSACRGRRFG